MKKKIKCHLCGGNTFSGMTPFRGTSRRYVTDFLYGQCEKCMSLVRLTEVTVDYSDYITSKNLQKTKALRLIKFLKYHGIGRDASILDYGCGNGSFLKTMQILGFHNARGYEPFNEEYQILEPGVKFSLIYLIHVFEHLTDFRKFFADINSVVDKNGKIIIITPSSSRMGKLDSRNPNQQFAIHAPYHTFIPSDDVIIQLFRSHNFTLRERTCHDIARSGLFANNNFSALLQHHLGGAKEDLLTTPLPRVIKTILRHPASFINALLIDTRDIYVSTFVFEKK